MLNIHGIIRRLSFLLLFAGFGISATAADIQWRAATTRGGLTVMQPRINSEALVDEIALLRGELLYDEKRLTSLAEEKRFTSKDSVLAALLPGGLLYAAYKKNAHSLAVKDVARASAQLREITSDLLAFTSTAGPVMLAQVR